MDRKISDLPLLANIALDDYVQIIDASEPDVALQNKRVTIQTLQDQLSFTLTDGSGTTANGSSVDLGGVLNSSFVLFGDGNDVSLGTFSSRLGYVEINVNDGIFITNTGNGVSNVGGFLETVIIGDQFLSTQSWQSLPRPSGTLENTLNFVAGSNFTGNYFGVDYGVGEGKQYFQSADGVDKGAIIHLNPNGNDLFFSTGYYNVTQNAFSPLLTPINTIMEFVGRNTGSELGWYITESNGYGLNYTNRAVDEANITTSDKNHIPSWGFIEDNFVVIGSGVSIDNSVVRFDGVDGRNVQESLVLINDLGNIATPTGLSSTDNNNSGLSFSGAGIITQVKADGVIGWQQQAGLITYNASGAILTHLWRGAGGAEVMRIEADGDIGINNPTPAFGKVDINKELRFQQVNQDNIANQILARDSNNDVVWVDKATIGGNLEETQESIIEGSWNGNTNYQYSVTVTGSQVGENFIALPDEDVFANINTAGTVWEGYAYCAAAGTVTVVCRVTSFISIPASSIFTVIKL